MSQVSLFNNQQAQAGATQGLGGNIETIASVSSQAIASPTGVSPQGQQILNVLNAHSTKASSIPSDVRAFRKSTGNPFDHEDATSVRKHDFTIPGETTDLSARLYKPDSHATNTSPALVYFHGGGFVLGDIESYDKMLSQLCKQSNTIVISVEYRLAPETPFPGAVEDTLHTYTWIRQHASDLGIDSENLAIGGDSAGANLAINVCRYYRDQGFTLPKLQLLIYPSIAGNDSTESREAFSEGLLLTKTVLNWFHDHYIPREIDKDPRFNLLQTTDLSNLPPAFVLTGGFDPLRDEGYRYAEVLRNNGIAVRHSCYTNMFHGFINFGVLAESQAAVSECANVLSNLMNTH